MSYCLLVPDDDKAVTTGNLVMTRALSRPWHDRPEGALGANELLSCPWKGRYKVSLVPTDDTPTEVVSYPRAGGTISLPSSLLDGFHWEPSRVRH